MSFILDALQRAQKAHDQSPSETGAITADQVPDAPANLRERVVWLGLAAMTAVSIALIAWWLGRESAAPDSNTVATPALTPPTTRPALAQSAPPARSANRAPVRSLDQEAARGRPAPKPQPTAATDIKQAVDAGATLITPNRPGSVEIMPTPAAQPASQPVTSGNDPNANLPQYENLLLEGKINLPNLKMDMHVFNATPAKRFVFVNFEKFREGDALDGNTQIEEITTRGAVLNHKGRRFLLRPN